MMVVIQLLFRLVILLEIPLLATILYGLILLLGLCVNNTITLSQVNLLLKLFLKLLVLLILVVELVQLPIVLKQYGYPAKVKWDLMFIHVAKMKVLLIVIITLMVDVLKVIITGSDLCPTAARAACALSPFLGARATPPTTTALVWRRLL